MNILYAIVILFCCSVQRSYGKLCGEECCAFYFKSDGDCKECPLGTIRLSGDKEYYCTPCPSGYYGYKCLDSCHCSKHERCDLILGCIPKKGDEILVDSQQVGSNTNRRSIESTTNDMNLKDEKDKGPRFNYKEILLDIIPFVVLAFVILVIGSILKRANDSCKRYEVDNIADNKSHHDGNNETGSKKYTAESENRTEFSAKD